MLSDRVELSSKPSARFADGSIVLLDRVELSSQPSEGRILSIELQKRMLWLKRGERASFYPLNYESLCMHYTLIMCETEFLRDLREVTMDDDGLHRMKLSYVIHVRNRIE